MTVRGLFDVLLTIGIVAAIPMLGFIYWYRLVKKVHAWQTRQGAFLRHPIRLLNTAAHRFLNARRDRRLPETSVARR